MPWTMAALVQNEFQEIMKSPPASAKNINSFVFSDVYARALKCGDLPNFTHSYQVW